MATGPFLEDTSIRLPFQAYCDRMSSMIHCLQGDFESTDQPTRPQEEQNRDHQDGSTGLKIDTLCMTRRLCTTLLLPAGATHQGL
jgi:hypothetical protein